MFVLESAVLKNAALVPRGCVRPYHYLPAAPRALKPLASPFSAALNLYLPTAFFKPPSTHGGTCRKVLVSPSTPNRLSTLVLSSFLRGMQ